MTDRTSDLDCCYFCESTDELEDHHIVPQRFRGGDGRDNIVTVCHDCHWKLERLYNKDFYEALGIEDPRSSREKHTVCDFQGCTNLSTTRYPVSTESDSAVIYRCDEHDESRETKYNSFSSLFENNPGTEFTLNEANRKVRESGWGQDEIKRLLRSGFIEIGQEGYRLNHDHYLVD